MTEINRRRICLEAEMDRLDQKVKHENKLKEMDDRLREENEKLRMRIKHLQKEVKDRDCKVSDLKDMLQRIQTDNRVNKQYKDVHGKDEVGLDDTKTLPNKATGDRMSDINPNNTNQSDKNRPAKLAERCVELYDNQWTDAFDNLENYSDKKENFLLNVLHDAMTFCKTMARTQMEELGRDLTFAEQHIQGNGDMVADVRKLFNDCKRIMAPVAVGNLYKRYVSHLERSTDKTLRSALEVSSYTSECLEICWLMVIHDPPVAFAPEARKDSTFDTDLYKPYTTSGTHIDYVVWPPVLLHEGGPLLAKGVAQVYNKESSKNTDATSVE